MNMNRNHLSLWLLLLAAFIAVAAISFLGPVNIFGYELKDSGMAKTISAAKPSIELPDTIAEAEVSEASPFPAPLDTLPQTILFFGDSMLDGLYPRLAAYADENGHELYAVIWYSSTSEVWGKSERLNDYIERLHPTFIFVSLGANELFVKDISERREKYVKKIIADIDTIPYLWIGPPNWKDDTGINDLIAANTAPGCFFLSNGMSFQRKSDGAHPTNESSNLWMDSIARWMPLHGAHPIRMELPEKSRSRAKRVFVHQPSES